MNRNTLIAAAAVLVATTLRCTDHQQVVGPNTPGFVAVGHVPGGVPGQTLNADDPSNPMPDGGMAADAGTPDAGGLDAGSLAGLPPEDPTCANHGGDGSTCWSEWLKEQGNTSFTPVAKGQLGAGPWATTATVTMGAAQGLKPPILYVGIDTAENIYAVSAGSLFIRRAGQASFEEYAQNTNGLKNYPFLSVAGQAPGVAYVGHVGLTPDSEFNTPPTDPPELLQSGGIDKVTLTPTGIQVTPYYTHNSNSPSGAYSHDRTLYNLFVPKRGPAAGELYSSSEHCVSRRVDDGHYASHRHVEVDYGGSAHYGAARAVTVTDDGYMWYGSDFEFGALQWHPRLYEWYFNNPWVLPTNVYGSEEQQDWYRGIGVGPNGDVWAAARGNGIAHLANVDVTCGHGSLETINPPDLNLNTLTVDLDGSVWVGADGGLSRYTPTTQKWTSYSAAGGGVSYVFLDDTVTPRAIYAATHDGIFVYRGP